MTARKSRRARLSAQASGADAVLLLALKSRLDSIDASISALRGPLKQAASNELLAIRLMRCIADRPSSYSSEDVVASILRELVKEIAGEPATCSRAPADGCSGG